MIPEAKLYDNVTRLFDILDHLSKHYPDKKDILAKKKGEKWIKTSTEEYCKASNELASGFMDFGLKEGDKVITICQNRPEWNFIDMALCMTKVVHIPVYTTLSLRDLEYIFNDCKVSVVCVENISLLKYIIPVLEHIKNNASFPVPRIVLMDETDKSISFPTVYLSDIRKTGQKKFAELSSRIESLKKSVTPDMLCTIIYTSGTTGLPKGVMLSHNNLLFESEATGRRQYKGHKCKMLSFLPLCHIYERSMNYEYQLLGISTYYAESLSTIATDMASCRADGFCAVPRVIEMMYLRLENAGKNLHGIKKKIYKMAFRFANKFDNYNNNWFYLAKLHLADKAVYCKWRAALGGKEMLIVSGGSSISSKIVRTFNAAKLHIFEGYGMTETSPVIAANNPDSHINIIGTAGTALEGTEIKISPDSEILTRGPHVMMGYYNDPEGTKAAIDSEGFFHTGDIGFLKEGKYLVITDRKKEIFKLSGGKYIAPQVIENILKNSTFIENCIVIGEHQKFPSAIIVPNFNKLHFWAIKHHVTDYLTDSDLIKFPQVIKKIHDEVNKANTQLATFEQIRREKLTSEDWTVLNGMLSQTLKLKRKVIQQHYASLIDDIYSFKK